MKHDKTDRCELCGRSDTYLNFHHLIPRKNHNKKKFATRIEKEFMKDHGLWICKFYCHKTIHIFYSEKYLAENLNTKEKLLADEKMQKYIKWHQKQKNVSNKKQ